MMGLFIMYTNSQARKAINDKIKSFDGINKNRIQWTNQKDFTPPSSGLWCRVTIQYSDSISSGLNLGQCERDFGIVSIQCFARKGTGDLDLIDLADKWREHFRGFTDGHLQAYKTNAPTDVSNELNTDFISTLVRIEFRVN